MRAAGRLSELLFRTVIGALFAFAMCRVVLATTILKVEPGWLMLWCTGFVAGMNLICYNTRTSLFSLIGMAVAAGGMLVYLWIHDFEIAWYQSLLGRLREVIAFAQGGLAYREAYGRVLGAAIAFAASLLTALNMGLLSYYTLVVLAAVTVAVPLVMDWNTAPEAVMIFAFCLVAVLLRRMNLFAVIQGEASRARYALLALPAAVLVFLAAWALPKPELELDSAKAGENMLSFAEDLFANFGQQETTAFTPDGGRLGGEIAPDQDQTLMLVQAQERVYLSGSVRDYYTGSSWQARGERFTAVLPLDDENQYAAGEYPPELEAVQQYYMRYYGRSMGNVTIDMGNVRTDTIFTPPFRTGLLLPQEAELTRSSHGPLRTKPALAAYSRYIQSYIAWDYQSVYFKNILRMPVQGVDTAAAKADLQAYLQLPENLPARVGELAAEVAGGFANDYDKLAALETYLQSFPYTLTPPTPPAGSDFVDCFLFESQQGYCVYYASAMAVMARTLGIPTRYAEGFVLPPERNADGLYEITGAQAHAWVEAFFPGFGWVQFEPTGGDYAGNNTAQEPREAERPVPTPRPDPEPDPELPPEPSPEPGEPEPDMPPDEPEAEQEAAGMHPVAAVLLALLAAGAALAAYLRMRHIRRRLERLDTLPGREAVIGYFRRSLRLLEALGSPLLRSETASSYAARVGDTAALAACSLPQLCAIFERAMYSKLSITVQERDLARACYRELLRRLRTRKKTLLLYYWGHYIAGTY